MQSNIAKNTEDINDSTGVPRSLPAPLAPPDGGWGWMCVVGCALMHFLVVGYTRSYGLIYMRLRTRYDSSAALTAWIGGACIALRLGCSPLSNALSRHFSARNVVFSGGLLYGTGCVLNAFATSTEYMIFSHSLMSGLGSSLMFAPSLVVVNEYFDKKRSIALGLSTAGSSVGAFVVPHLMEFLFDQFGFSGGLLVLGAITYNGCVSGALYRPLNKPVTPNPAARVTEASRYGGQVADGTRSRLRRAAIAVDGLFDFSVWRDWRFAVFAVSQGVCLLCLVPVWLLLPAVAKDNGLTEGTSTFALSSIAVTDVIGRLLSGFVFDHPSVRDHRYRPFSVSMLLVSILMLWWPFVDSPLAIFISAAVYGVGFGVIMAQRSNILRDLIGIERFSSAFGMMVFAQGIGVFLGPLMAGVFKDYFGSYKLAFLFLGVLMGVAAVMCYVVNALSLGTPQPAQIVA